MCSKSRGCVRCRVLVSLRTGCLFSYKQMLMGVRLDLGCFVVGRDETVFVTVFTGEMG